MFCKPGAANPKFQASAAQTLDVILGSTIVGSFDVALMPNNADCRWA